jgi:hypothetical protein
MDALKEIEPMNTTPSDNRPKECSARSARLLIPLHNDGQWCPRCGSFAISPDPRHTAHIQTKRPSRTSSFVSLRVTAGVRAAGPISAGCGGPGDTGDGIYDDGDWLCGGCIAGLLERADDI